jgi:acetate---CoA ligase (ADP-forming)
VVMVQRQAPAGTEVMLSVLRDPELGPLAIVRPGGIFTELISGSAILWGGWDRTGREAALRASTVGRLLDGYRNGPVYAVGALQETIEQLLGSLADAEISFIELNPVLVTTTGVHLVDALVKVS